MNVNVNIAVAGLRYGKTKLQAETLKKYLEENYATNLNITILDSESKKRLDKAIKYMERNKNEAIACLYCMPETVESLVVYQDLLKILRGD